MMVGERQWDKVRLRPCGRHQIRGWQTCAAIKRAVHAMRRTERGIREKSRSLSGFEMPNL
jgi:hypothetical protein